MKKVTGILCLILALVCVVVALYTTSNKEVTTIVEHSMTVDDVVSRAGCGYFIVKEVDTLAVLNEDVYMDREVVEINICDDTKDTLCLFIDLNDNEPQRVRKA